VSFTVVGDCRRLRTNAGVDLSHHAPSYCGRNDCCSCLPTE
jgi:hypothetical protein